MKSNPAPLFLVHQETGQRYPIQGPLVLGRGAGDLNFTHDKKLSQRHCRIQITPRGPTIEDLGSANGTSVNGQSLPPQKPFVLRPGSVVLIGEQSFEVLLVSASHREPRRKARRLVKNGPEQFPVHVLLALAGLTFAWQLFSGLSWSHPQSEQMLLLGALSNAAFSSGQWWRLLTSPFLHAGWIHLVCASWALLVIGEGVAHSLGGRSFLQIALFSALGGNLAAIAMNSAGHVTAGLAAVDFGLMGGWSVLLMMDRLQVDKVNWSVGASLIAVGLTNVGWNSTPFEPFHLIGGFCAGLITAVALVLMRAERKLGPEIQVAVGLSLLTIALSTQIPVKTLSLTYRRVDEAKMTTPLEMVEDEMNHALKTYEELGRRVEGQGLPPREMAGTIRDDLRPELTRVQAKLAVIQPLGEAERRKLETERKLVHALLEQVSAMERYSITQDLKSNQAIEKWSLEVEQLNLDWKRQKALPPRQPAAN